MSRPRSVIYARVDPDLHATIIEMSAEAGVSMSLMVEALLAKVVADVPRPVRLRLSRGWE